MNHPIVFTPYELWTIILAVCGGIVAVSGAITVIVKLLAKLKEPELNQNDRITKCEKDIDGIKQQFKVYDGYFAHDKQRLDRLEFGNEAENRALLALLNHAINGNNQDELKAAKSELERFLISEKRVAV